MSQHKKETRVLSNTALAKGSMRTKFIVGGAPAEDGYDRYEVGKMIGSGAYGIVHLAKDLKTNKDVAIKQIKTAFECIVDAKRILREIKLLSK